MEPLAPLFGFAHLPVAPDGFGVVWLSLAWGLELKPAKRGNGKPRTTSNPISGGTLMPTQPNGEQCGGGRWLPGQGLNKGQLGVCDLKVWLR